MMRDLDGRELVIPLSAGRDSRAIASAARHLGYNNVRTFAYGHPGNHEARASEEIARRLGYPWHFVAIGRERMRDFYASSLWSQYVRYADTLQATPFVQDLPVLEQLQALGLLGEHAVICNGNSGDYLSGGHITPAVSALPIIISAPCTVAGMKQRWHQSILSCHLKCLGPSMMN